MLRSIHVYARYSLSDSIKEPWNVTQRSALEELIASLKQERDELKLKIHLAGMEGREEYERLSGKIDELTHHYEPVKDAVQESASNVFSAFLLAAGEMKNGFHRVRKAISEE